MSAELIDLFYLVAAVLFILGLKGLSHPRTAVRGNLLGATGMLVAIVVTLLDRRIVSFEIIVAGLIVGALIGVVLAYRAPMTAMPQVVAIFNGFGGGASALAVGAALEEALRGGSSRRYLSNSRWPLPPLGSSAVYRLRGAGSRLASFRG